MSARTVILILLCVLSAYCQIRQECSPLLSFLTEDFRHLMLIRGSGRDKMESKLGCLLEKRVGTWKCDLGRLDYPVSNEWRDAVALYLEIDGFSNVGLWVEGGGRASPIRVSGKGFLTDRSIFAGANTNGFCFVYTVFSNRMYTLFSPDGLQRRLVFEKLENAQPPLPSARKDGTGDRKARPITATSGNCQSDISGKGHEQPMGWFESASPIPLAFLKHDVDKLYLRINGPGKVFFLYGKSGKVCLDRVLFDPPFTARDCYLEQDFAYAFDGNARIELACLPPLINEYYELQISTLDKDSDHAKSMLAYLSRLDEKNKKRILRWIDPVETPEKIVFVHIPDANIPYERFSLASEFSVWGGKAVWNDQLEHAFQKFSPWITMTKDGVIFGDQPNMQKLLSKEEIYDLFVSRVYYDFVLTNGTPMITP